MKISAVHLQQCILCAVQFSEVKLYTAQNMCSAVWGSALQCSAATFSAVQRVQLCAVRFCAVKNTYSSVQFSAV